jgi:hypothetical protein
MVNPTGIKSPGVDVAQKLERAGDANGVPTKLGAGGLEAFKALTTLTKLADLLPAALQPFAKGLLFMGIEGVGRNGDNKAREAVRDYTQMLAVKNGRVPVEVLDRAASPKQREALVDAARNGDAATVKSILRHNQKTGASDDGAPPTTA